MTSFDELEFRMFAAIERFALQTLTNNWKGIEYHLDILRVMNDTHIEVV
jgi:hypothetical protein